MQGWHLLILLCVFGRTVSALAEDWSEFRGPSGQGLSDQQGLPLHWSETEGVEWKSELPGLGWSSPVTSAGKVFLTTCIDQPASEGQAEQHELRGLCLDAKNGQVLWNIELFRKQGALHMHPKNSHASPTPIVDHGRVYFHFGPHGTACVNLDGQIQWKTTELSYDPRHGTGGSPAIADDLLIICCDGHDTQHVVGLELATGKVRWKTPRNANAVKGFSFSTPLLIQVADKPQIVCPGSSAVISYEPSTGLEIWRCQYGTGYSVVPRPIFANGLIFVSSSYDTAQLLAIDPTGSGDVTESHLKWKTDKQVPHNPSMVAVDDMLFFISDRGIATCVDAMSGDQHWQHRIEGNYSASPLAVGGRIYFQNENGVATVIAASKEFEVLATNTFAPEERTFASYAVVDRALLIRSEKHLYRISESASARAE